MPTYAATLIGVFLYNMDRCIICSSILKGQRWRYCSDGCVNVGSSRDLKKRVRKLELIEIKKEIKYKRVELNSSNNAFNEIKKIMYGV